MSHVPGLAHSAQPPTPLVPVARHESARSPDRKRRPSPPLPVRHSSPVQTVARVRTQKHQPSHAAFSPVTSSRREYSLTKYEFDFCRQRLRSVFSKCTNTEFMRLSVIFSCLLNCFRALHVSETATILAILLGNESGDEDHSGSSQDSTVKRLQATCSQIFFLDSAGFLHFAHPLIPQYLLTYPVKGIDRSHALLAKACVIQLESDAGIQELGLTGAEPLLANTSAFSVYAAEHWQEHYRRVESSSPGVTARIHHMLWNEVTERTGCADCGALDYTLRRELVVQALEFCASREFQVLSTSYARLLAGVDSESCPEDVAESHKSASVNMLEKSPNLDQALAEIELTEGGSDSDGWSLV